MWEELNVPIVPLIFYGAYELYPPNSWVNSTGKWGHLGGSMSHSDFDMMDILGRYEMCVYVCAYEMCVCVFVCVRASVCVCVYACVWCLCDNSFNT